MTDQHEHEYGFGVDWAQEDGDKTCLVITHRNDKDGVVTVLADLHGEAAEYVAGLYAENATLKSWQEDAFEAYPNIDLDIERIRIEQLQIKAKYTTVVNHLSDQLDWINKEDAVRIITQLVEWLWQQ